MIRFFRRFRRVISLSIASFVLLVPVFLADRASAVAYDYNDLNPVVVVDGDNDLVTVNLDVSKCAFSVRNVGIKFGSVTLPENDYFWVSVFPLGCSMINGKYAWDVLDGFNIPSGTVFTIGLRVSYAEQTVERGKLNYESYLDIFNSVPVSTGYAPTTISGSIVSDYSSNNNLLSMQVTYTKTGTSDDYILPWVYIKTIETDRACTITATTCRLTFSISSLYRQQMLTGKTNKLLDEVNKQLEANGQKLDDIINKQEEITDRPVSPIAPTGSGSVGDYGQIEDQILQDISGGLNNVTDMQQSLPELLYQYANGFTFLTWVVNGFTDIPVLHFLLYVSICIGTFGLLVGSIYSMLRGSTGSSGRGGGKK